MKTLDVKINHSFTIGSGTYDLSQIKLLILLGRFGFKSKAISDATAMDYKMNWWRQGGSADMIVMPAVAYRQLVKQILGGKDAK